MIIKCQNSGSGFGASKKIQPKQFQIPTVRTKEKHLSRLAESRLVWPRPRPRSRMFPVVGKIRTCHITCRLKRRIHKWIFLSVVPWNPIHVRII